MGQRARDLSLAPCDLCQASSARLYMVPQARRLTGQAPRAVCYFCYLRVVGIRPTQRQIVPQTKQERVRTPMGHTKGTVLIVDDDRDIADLVLEVLQEEGYAVLLVHEPGSDAVRIAVDEVEPDCVLLDGGVGASYGSSWDDAI